MKGWYCWCIITRNESRIISFYEFWYKICNWKIRNIQMNLYSKDWFCISKTVYHNLDVYTTFVYNRFIAVFSFVAKEKMRMQPGEVLRTDMQLYVKVRRKENYITLQSSNGIIKTQIHNIQYTRNSNVPVVSVVNFIRIVTWICNFFLK